MALAKSASHDVVASEQQWADLMRQSEVTDRVALDTEADSLHSYREKLCLLQISVPAEVISSKVEESRGADLKIIPGGPPTSRRMPVSRQHDLIVDPLGNLDLEPLRHVLQSREIV